MPQFEVFSVSREANYTELLIMRRYAKVYVYKLFQLIENGIRPTAYCLIMKEITYNYILSMPLQETLAEECYTINCIVFIIIFRVKLLTLTASTRFNQLDTLANNSTILHMFYTSESVIQTRSQIPIKRTTFGRCYIRIWTLLYHLITRTYLQAHRELITNFVSRR